MSADFIQTQDSAEAWLEIKPEVNSEAEFLEIASDFGNPLEIVREGISNALDASATEIRISFTVEEIDGATALVIRLQDNGSGMTKGQLTRDFWGLGFSDARNDPHKIGEKGHGTKIYLRSESVRVVTTGAEGTFESVCERPMRDLSRNRSHKPVFRPASGSMRPQGTLIEIVGYNQNERALFVQSAVKDYIQWFSKFGSIERIFGIEDYKDVKLYLKCLDVTEFEEIPFGHPFPDENSDIDALFKSLVADAADHYVRRYKSKSQERL